MGYADFRNMKDFLKYVVGQVHITEGTARVGVYTFNNDAILEFKLNEYDTNQEVIDAIDKIPQTFGNTNTAAALRALQRGFTADNGDRPNVPNVGVLVTDGQANMETSRTLTDATAFKATGAHLYTLVMKQRDTQEFRDLASTPSDALFLSTFSQLLENGPHFVRKLCQGILCLME